MKYILGNFNSIMEGKVLIDLDEASWGGRRSDVDALKEKITEEKQVIEKKGRDPFTISDGANYIITFLYENYTQTNSGYDKKLVNTEFFKKLRTLVNFVEIRAQVHKSRIGGEV